MKKELKKMREYRKAKNINELKKIIYKKIISGYDCKIDFDNPNFLIEIGEVLIISAILYKEENEMLYKFIFNTDFIGDHLVTYEEIKMIQTIMNILNINKKLITSRFKKYSVEEYEEELKKANEIVTPIKTAFEKALKKAYEEIELNEEKNLEEINEYAHTIVTFAVNEIIILEEEVNEIIKNECENEKIIKYIFDKILSLDFIPLEKIEPLYFRLIDYVKGFNIELADDCAGIFYDKFNDLFIKGKMYC